MNEKYVPWAVFIWVVGIVTILLGGLFSWTVILSGRVNGADISFVRLEVQLTNIQKDVLEIKTDVKTHLNEAKKIP